MCREGLSPIWPDEHGGDIAGATAADDYGARAADEEEAQHWERLAAAAQAELALRRITSP
jgi:hypothetical protein